MASGIPYEIDSYKMPSNIIDDLRFYNEQVLIHGSRRKGGRSWGGVPIMGKRNPRDGLRDVDLSTSARSKKRKVKSTAIGIGSKPHGSPLPAFIPSIRGRSFVDYRG